jgi:mannitol/fructose-specific phosphotransferase system IIA component (Ntr-type)
VEEKKQMEISQLESIFPNNAIAYMENAKSIEQLLTLGFEILETNGYVQPVVKEELLAAYEKFGLYFEILPGVIMPHVLSPNVNKAGLSCICLKEPFVIHGKEIQTVITLVSPNEKEHVQLLQLLYELVSKTKSGFELNSIIEKRDRTYAT